MLLFFHFCSSDFSCSSWPTCKTSSELFTSWRPIFIVNFLIIHRFLRKQRFLLGNISYLLKMHKGRPFLLLDHVYVFLYYNTHTFKYRRDTKSLCCGKCPEGYTLHHTKCFESIFRSNLYYCKNLHYCKKKKKICRQMKLLLANIFSARRQIAIPNQEIYSRGTEVWGTTIINTLFATLHQAFPCIPQSFSEIFVVCRSYMFSILKWWRASNYRKCNQSRLFVCRSGTPRSSLTPWSQYTL